MAKHNNINIDNLAGLVMMFFKFTSRKIESWHCKQSKHTHTQ